VHRSTLFAALAALLAACGPSAPAAKTPAPHDAEGPRTGNASLPSGPGAHETRGVHTACRWTSGPGGTASDAEASAVLARADSAFEKLAALLGPARSPNRTPTIVLEGDGIGPKGLVGIPHVSLDGVVHLYRYPGAGGEYESPIAHELVHAFRIARTREHIDQHAASDEFWFIEEGYAETVARQIRLASEGFPLYGVPLDVVAGQWLAHDEDIPILDLMAHHEALNPKCTAQAYAIRASFFAFLVGQFGFARVTELAYLAHPTRDAYAKVLGIPAERLAEDWRTWASERYRRADRAEELARYYREQTPARFLPVCPRQRSPE
jgi:hypothetical protein